MSGGDGGVEGGESGGGVCGIRGRRRRNRVGNGLNREGGRADCGFGQNRQLFVSGCGSCAFGAPVAMKVRRRAKRRLISTWTLLLTWNQSLGWDSRECR